MSSEYPVPTKMTAKQHQIFLKKKEKLKLAINNGIFGRRRYYKWKFFYIWKSKTFRMSPEKAAIRIQSFWRMIMAKKEKDEILQEDKSFLMEIVVNLTTAFHNLYLRRKRVMIFQVLYDNAMHQINDKKAILAKKEKKKIVGKLTSAFSNLYLRRKYMKAFQTLYDHARFQGLNSIQVIGANICHEYKRRNTEGGNLEMSDPRRKLAKKNKVKLVSEAPEVINPSHSARESRKASAQGGEVYARAEISQIPTCTPEKLKAPSVQNINNQAGLESYTVINDRPLTKKLKDLVPILDLRKRLHSSTTIQINSFGHATNKRKTQIEAKYQHHSRAIDLSKREDISKDFKQFGLEVRQKNSLTSLISLFQRLKKKRQLRIGFRKLVINIKSKDLKSSRFQEIERILENIELRHIIRRVLRILKGEIESSPDNNPEKESGINLVRMDTIGEVAQENNSSHECDSRYLPPIDIDRLSSFQSTQQLPELPILPIYIQTLTELIQWDINTQGDPFALSLQGNNDSQNLHFNVAIRFNILKSIIRIQRFIKRRLMDNWLKRNNLHNTTDSFVFIDTQFKNPKKNSCIIF